MSVSSGKWYVEGLYSSTSYGTLGIVADSLSPLGNLNGSGNFAYMYYYLGSLYTHDGVGDSNPDDYADDDIIGVAFNLDDNLVYWHKNGTWITISAGVQNPATPAHGLSIASDKSYVVGTSSNGNNAEWYFNFGQDSSFAGNKTAQNNADSGGVGDFYYTPPTGYKALCTKNLPAPAITDPSEHFNTIVYDDGAGAKT
ncbi:MAG: hypothetical protein QF704_14315, partial [Anaerolineales bacterium]|nr:hypothetical protein [Anaerolineales bacterium]